MLPLMRDMRKGQCPVCEHDEVLESVVAEFGHSDFEKPMCVTYDPRWMFEGRNPTHGYGPLRIYVCRSCGFAQWFAGAPEKIPVGDDYRTRIINGPGTDGPYR